MLPRVGVCCVCVYFVCIVCVCVSRLAFVLTFDVKRRFRVCVCVCKGNPPSFYVKKLSNSGPRAGLGPTEVGQIRITYDKV